MMRTGSNRILPLIILLFALGVLVVACAGTPVVVEREVIKEVTPEPQAMPLVVGPDTLVYSLRNIARQGYDARQAFLTTSRGVAQTISEALLAFDWEEQKVEPRLAESWEISEDGMSITFNLRQGVTFHDGTPFNADAVVFNLEQVFDEDHPYHDQGRFPWATAMFPTFEGVVKVDEFTVRVTTSQPDPLLEWRMSTDPTFIGSPTAIMELGENYKWSPVGTGPWFLEELDKETKVVVQAYEEYWGPKPAVKTIIFKINTNDDSRVEDLLAGGVDLMERPPGGRIPQLRNTPGLKVQLFPAMSHGYFNVNVTKPMFEDPKVRLALAYALDRETYAREIENGTQTALRYNLPDAMWAHDPNVPEVFEYDPEKAKALLAEAGWEDRDGDGWLDNEDGERLTFTIISQQQSKRISDISLFFQSNLRAIGIAAHVTILDTASAFDPVVGLFNPEIPEVNQMGIAAFLPDPSFDIERWLCRTRSPNGFNISQYCNQELDRLAKEAETELDMERRAQLFSEIQRIASQDPPWIPTTMRPTVAVAKEQVNGFRWDPNWVLDFRNVTLSER
jgi:peptide/nickel transport system substrate-binding protein